MTFSLTVTSSIKYIFASSVIETRGSTYTYLALALISSTGEVICIEILYLNIIYILAILKSILEKVVSQPTLV
jgi:hypothetical protein